MNSLPDEISHIIINDAARFYINERLEKGFRDIHEELYILQKISHNEMVMEVDKKNRYNLSEYMLYIIYKYPFYTTKARYHYF